MYDPVVHGINPAIVLHHTHAHAVLHAGEKAGAEYMKYAPEDWVSNSLNIVAVCYD